MATKDEIADDTTPVFTEAEVFIIAGWLAEHWEVECDVEQHCEDVQEAIQFALRDDGDQA